MNQFRLRIAALLTVIIAIIILAVATFQWGANGLQASATVVLVALTAWYAIQTRRSLEETKNERRRPYILSLVTEGIDPVLNQVRNNNQRIDERDTSRYSDRCLYPNLSLGDELTEEMIADLNRDGFTVAKDYEIYRDLISTYGFAYTELRLELRDHIQREFSDWVENKEEALPENPPVTVGDSQDEINWENVPYFFGGDFTEWVLLGFAPSDRTHEIFEPFERNLMALRNNRFEEEFSYLDETIDDVDDWGNLLSEDLESVRSAYMERYDVTEMEAKSKVD